MENNNEKHGAEIEGSGLFKSYFIRDLFEKIRKQI
jgi:hypothetical protein